MMKCRIYYTEGEVYDGDPLNAPTTIGVACVVYPGEKGRVIHNRNGYYLYCKTGWLPIDNIDGLIDQMLHNFSNVLRVFQGRSMTNEAFWKLYDRVKKENPI
jgi:hypothetical protein